MDKKLSKTFINFMRRKSVNISVENDREIIAFENKYMVIHFSNDIEYDCLRIVIVERSTENDVKHLEDYAKAMTSASDIIKYAKLIFEVEKYVKGDIKRD